MLAASSSPLTSEEAVNDLTATRPDSPAPRDEVKVLALLLQAHSPARALADTNLASHPADETRNLTTRQAGISLS
eukprot:755602-Hanusia_phi.AAC.7